MQLSSCPKKKMPEKANDLSGDLLFKLGHNRHITIFDAFLLWLTLNSNTSEFIGMKNAWMHIKVQINNQLNIN